MKYNLLFFVFFAGCTSFYNYNHNNNVVVIPLKQENSIIVRNIERAEKKTFDYVEKVLTFFDTCNFNHKIKGNDKFVLTFYSNIFVENSKYIDFSNVDSTYTYFVVGEIGSDECEIKSQHKFSNRTYYKKVIESLFCGNYQEIKNLITEMKPAEKRLIDCFCIINTSEEKSIKLVKIPAPIIVEDSPSTLDLIDDPLGN